MESFVIVPFGVKKEEEEEGGIISPTCLEVKEEDPHPLRNNKMEMFTSSHVTTDLVPRMKVEPASKFEDQSGEQNQAQSIIKDLLMVKVKEEVTWSCSSDLGPVEVKQEPHASAMEERNNLKQDLVKVKQEASCSSDLGNIEVKQEPQAPAMGCSGTGRRINREIFWSCEQCTALFPSILQLEEHKTQCPAEKKPDSTSEDCVETWHRCNKCEFKSALACDLENHMRIHNVLPSLVGNGVTRHVCTVCDFACSSSDALTKHMKYHAPASTSKQACRCKLCDYKCLLIKDMTLHMVDTHTSESPFTCKVCDYKTEIAKHMEEHMLELHVKNNSCTVCNIKFVLDTTCTMHMNEHMNKKIYECGHCQIKFIDKFPLSAHMKEHTSHSFKCPVCDYSCSRKSKLQLHERTHTGEKPFACDKCDFRTAVKNTLYMHALTHSEQKPFICDKCDYKTKRSENLVVHMRLHTGEKPFSCKECDKTFRGFHQLNKHKKSHSGDTQLCEICGISQGKRSFIVHMRKHTGEKPFSCDECGYQGRSKLSLVSHIRKHTQEKPFQCTFCDYKCARNGNLVKHLRIHSGVKPYACSICSYKCSNSSNLKTHLKMHQRKMVE